MASILIENILYEFDQLDLENQEYILSIFQNKIDAKKKETFIEETLAAERDFQNGNFKSGSIQDFFNDLDDA